jgi:hypothetical protein
MKFHFFRVFILISIKPNQKYFSMEARADPRLQGISSLYWAV